MKEPSGAWRQLSLGEAATEAYRHLEQGNNETAQALLEKAVQVAPAVAIFRHLLGVAQFRQKLYAFAIPNLEKAVHAEDRNIDYLLALADALTVEQPSKALSHLTRAVELDSTNPQAWTRLAALLVELQKPEEALTVCDTGLNRCGPHHGILTNRGLALKALARYDAALECLRRAEVLAPPDATMMINLAGVLHDLGQPAEARTHLERACALEPDNAAAHYNLGLTLLLAGDYVAGFREYEARWNIRQMAGRAPVFPHPLWDGSDLNARRILLHAEQGAGDIVQFVRYVNFVRERGGHPIVLVGAPLARLLSWLPDCEVAVFGKPLPAADLRCPLVSLPRIAATDKDTIPPPAAFAIPAEMKQKWSEHLGTEPGLKVGIVWAGAPEHRNDRNRSLASRQFAPLLEIPGIRWFSLQVGQPPINGKVRDLAPLLTDYAETAAAISQLDLVISADTSVAHLAGSLGTPVWTLIPFAPDWRWLLGRSDSPWYPSMRLFRQPAARDWESVIETVGTALRQLTGAPAIRAASTQTDIARWSDVENLRTAWNERARMAADFIPAGGH